MRILFPDDLCHIDFFVRDLEVFPESWTKRNHFAQYEQTKRPASALFLVATDIRVTFHPQKGNPTVAERGDLVWIPMGTKYHVTVEGGSFNRIDTYTLNFVLLDETREPLLFSDQIFLLAKDEKRRLESAFGKLNNEMHRMDLLGEHGNALKIRALFYHLLDLLTSTSAQSEALYYPIRAGVEALKNEWNQNKPIASYAKLSGVSETYFYRCFRRFSGKSPIEYRNTLRLSNAETMLRKTDMKISEISETVGFEDPFYFCRIFSKVFGLSPQKYRALSQKNTLL